MPVARGFRMLVLATLALRAAVAGAQDVRPPDGLPAAPPMLARPGSGGAEWRAVLVNDQAAPTADAAGKTLLRADSLPPAGFGAVFHVVAQAKEGAHRLLLAKFDADRKFIRYYGWVAPDVVLDRDTPAKVGEARDALLASIPESDPQRERVEDELPVGERREFRSVTLKAVTHPERGRYCFVRPVSPDEEDAAVKANLGSAMQPFSFFYVYKMIARAGHIHCLLSARPMLDLTAGEAAEIRRQLLGWMELRNLTLWATREAFEYNLTDDARADRKRRNSPISLHKTRKQLTDALAAIKAGKAPTVAPVFTEDFAAPYMQQPWKPHVMRYPILDRYLLPGTRGADGAELSGYQLCVLGSAGGGGKVNIDPRDFDRYKSMVNDAIKNLRVFEVVLVLDRRAAVAGALDPLKKVIRELVADLVAEEASRNVPELERLYLRVAVVGYWDFPENDPAGKTKRLTDDSGKFFDVASKDEADRFGAYLDSLKAEGGAAAAAQPLEGVRTAVNKFLSDRPDSQHTKGAARMVVLFGGIGNADKSDGPPTKLDREDVLRMLQPAGAGKERKAKIALTAVHIPSAGEDPRWKVQMPYLAEQTGGAAVTVQFREAADAKTAAQRLKGTFAKVAEDRRETLRAEIDAVRQLFARAAPAAEFENAPVTRFARSRLEETIPASELGKVKSALSEFFFTNVHAVERLPDDPEELPRMQLCVLLTLQELIGIQSVCDSLARELQFQLNRKGAGDEAKSAHRDLLVQAMLTVMGSQAEVPPSEILRMRNFPLEKIQDMVGRLPIVFGCLKGDGPKDRKEIDELTRHLRRIAGDMKAVIAGSRERFFDPGVGAGELHIWMRPAELP